MQEKTASRESGTIIISKIKPHSIPFIRGKICTVG